MQKYLFTRINTNQLQVWNHRGVLILEQMRSGSFDNAIWQIYDCSLCHNPFWSASVGHRPLLKCEMCLKKPAPKLFSLSSKKRQQPSPFSEVRGTAYENRSANSLKQLKITAVMSSPPKDQSSPSRNSKAITPEVNLIEETLAISPQCKSIEDPMCIIIEDSDIEEIESNEINDSLHNEGECSRGRELAISLLGTTEQSNLFCLVCDTDLSILNDEEKEIHLHECIDTMESKSINDQVPSDVAIMASQCIGEDAELGIRGKAFFCVVCDLDLSRRGLISRCMHLKKCAKDHKISTKDLLQLISPIFEEPEDADVDDQFAENADETENIAHNHETTSKETLGNFESDFDTCLEDNVSDAPKVKNAWDVLMQSSKSLARSAISGGFQAKYNKNLKLSSSSSSSSHITNANAATASAIQTLSSTAARAAAPAKTSKAWGSKKGRFAKKPTSAGVIGYAPSYKKIQVGNMTSPIIVDGFQFAAKELSNCYFLTHFHSDHYIGLSKSFDAGIIYCSPTTAGLVRLKLGVNGPHLISLELDKIHVISVGGVDVQVILVDANHCPGAVCILFLFEAGRKILHTGDFRWNPDVMLASPVYKSLVCSPNASINRNLTIYLDTTYCDPNYNFPLQKATIKAVVKCVQRELEQQPKTLFLFGAYAIGKERVYMAVAEDQNMRVHVDKGRWRMMLCYDWTMEEKARLTTEPNQSLLWVVPMNQINFHSIESIIKKRPDCKRVVAFQPTGWTHQGSATAKHGKQNMEQNDMTNQHSMGIPLANEEVTLTPRVKLHNIIYSVPYSEHSSFGELVDCIQRLKPEMVIPTVNTGEEKVKQQLQLLKDASGVYKKNPSIETSHRQFI